MKSYNNRFIHQSVNSYQMDLLSNQQVHLTPIFNILHSKTPNYNSTTWVSSCSKMVLSHKQLMNKNSSNTTKLNHSNSQSNPFLLSLIIRNKILLKNIFLSLFFLRKSPLILRISNYKTLQNSMCLLEDQTTITTTSAIILLLVFLPDLKAAMQLLIITVNRLILIIKTNPNSSNNKN